MTILDDIVARTRAHLGSEPPPDPPPRKTPRVVDRRLH